MLSAGLALTVISLFFLIVLIIYSSPIRALIAETCGVKSWREPPALERKLTSLTSSVGEGLKKRFTFKMNEAKLA